MNLQIDTMETASNHIQLTDEQFRAWIALQKDVLSEKEAIAFLDVTEYYFRHNVRPYIKPTRQTRKVRFYSRSQLERYKYGDL